MASLFVSRRRDCLVLALMVDGELRHVRVCPESHERIRGCVAVARVEKVLSGVDAAFLDFGWRMPGFLKSEDVEAPGAGAPGAGPPVGRPPVGQLYRARPALGDWLKPGRVMLVQVAREAHDDKAPVLRQKVRLEGDTVILFPASQGVRFSKNLAMKKEEVKRLREELALLKHGFMVRTQAAWTGPDAVINEARSLMNRWDKLEAAVRQSGKPRILTAPLHPVLSFVMDHGRYHIDHITVDQEARYQELKAAFGEDMPYRLSGLHLELGPHDLFQTHKIESQLEQALAARVWLPSGGNIVFSPTPALTAVDVNSAKGSGKRSKQGNALKVNLEAAREIGRQIQLRDLGGLIVIDFIDLLKSTDQDLVLTQLRESLSMDRRKHQILDWNPFGLVHISREREGPDLLRQLSVPCSQCGGVGWITQHRLG